MNPSNEMNTMVPGATAVPDATSGMLGMSLF